MAINNDDISVSAGFYNCTVLKDGVRILLTKFMCLICYSYLLKSESSFSHTTLIFTIIRCHRETKTFLGSQRWSSEGSRGSSSYSTSSPGSPPLPQELLWNHYGLVRLGSIRNKNNWNNASKRLFGSYSHSGIPGFHSGYSAPRSRIAGICSGILSYSGIFPNERVPCVMFYCGTPSRFPSNVPLKR